MKWKFLGIVRVIWVLSCLAVLAYCQYVYDGKVNSDAEDVLIILMGILAFPATFVAGGIAFAIAFISERMLHTPFQSSRLELFCVWLLFIFAGYSQWFIGVPYAWSKWKGYSARRHNPSEK